MNPVLILCFNVLSVLPFGETRKSSTRPDDFEDDDDLILDCSMITNMFNELKQNSKEYNNAQTILIKNLQQDIEIINKNVIEERKTFTNIITKQQKEIEILNNNIAELIKINLKSESGFRASAFKGNSTNSWDACAKEPLRGVKFVFMENPNNIDELLNILNLESDKDIVSSLIKAYATDIWDAAAQASLPAVKFYLMENPTYINKKNKNYRNYTLLHYASENGIFKMVEFLISQGAEIDPIDSFRHRTPLMLAAWNGHLSIVEYLIDHGANVNKKNLLKSPVLNYGIEGDHLDVVKLLIKNGAKTNIKDRHSRTPLDYAKYLKKPSIVKYLSQNRD